MPVVCAIILYYDYAIFFCLVVITTLLQTLKQPRVKPVEVSPSCKITLQRGNSYLIPAARKTTATDIISTFIISVDYHSLMFVRTSGRFETVPFYLL